jgi:hypothetical protein
MSRLRPVLTVAATALLLACPLLADPFQKEQVSAKAKWFVHADVKAFLASKTGAFVLEELKRKKGLKAVLDNIQEVFALDVTKDLKSVTVYGSRFGDHAAIVLIRAAMDRDRMTEILSSNPTYRELKYAGHTLHQWTDNPDSDRPGPTKFGVFHGDDLAIMAEDLPLIQEAVDVLDKKAGSLGTRAARSLPPAAKDTFLTAFVTELPPIGEGKPEGVILRKIASGSLEAGESKGRLRAQVALMAKTAKTAGDLRKVAEGVLALVDLALPEQAGTTAAPAADQVVFQGKAIPAELIAVLKGVTVSAQGRTVKVAAEVPVDSAIALLRKIIDPEGAADAEPATAEK